MTAPNHAMTGALIGLTVASPVLALPLAFLSHFALDAIPHYDPPGKDNAERIGSRRFLYELLFAGAGLCLALVVVLVATRPQHWLLAAICAFLAASPDLFWLPRFIHVKRTGKDRPPRMWFTRFHSFSQWRTGPGYIWLEAVWFVIACYALSTLL